MMCHTIYDFPANPMLGSINNMDIPSLEVVYYPKPIPSGPVSLTFMGLIFDKIHFPRVYFPHDNYDLNEVIKEAERLEKLERIDYNTAVLIGSLRFLPIANQLREFCYFTGKESEAFGDDEKGTDEIIKALDEELFGPPKKNFIPIYEKNYVKGLPGNESSIHYPGSLQYPANALIYSAKHDIPLINDDPHMPVPARGGDSPKNNSKLLATILAMECASFVLPKLKPLNPQEILEMRHELSDYLVPFRLSVLRLAGELNKAITTEGKSEDVIQAAKFLVETEVQPSLIELQNIINAPSKKWYYRAFDAAKQVPELATAYATMPPNLAIAKTLTAIGNILVDIHAEQAENEAKRSGMYYLLKLKEANE